MATRKYSLDTGKTLDSVTQGVGSATTVGVELTIDLAKVITEEQAVLAIENIKNYIIQSNWPPA
jgi:hypothetical protein